MDSDVGREAFDRSQPTVNEADPRKERLPPEIDPISALNRLLSQVEELLPQAPMTRRAIAASLQQEVAQVVRVLEYHGYSVHQTKR